MTSTRGCAWRDIRFGAGKTPSIGLERPHLWRPSAAQRNRGVAPAQCWRKSLASSVFCPRQEKRDSNEQEESTCRSSISTRNRKTRIRNGGTRRARRREIRRVHRQHAGPRRQFGSQECPLPEGQAIQALGKAATGDHGEERLRKPPRSKRAKSMIQRILNSKNFVACLLAAATGMALYFQAAISRRESLSATHGSPSAPGARGLLLLLQPLPIHDPVYRLFDCALRPVCFRPQGASNEFVQASCHPIPTHGNARNFSLLSARSTIPASQALGNPSLAHDPRARPLHRHRHRRRDRVAARRAAACIRSPSRFSPIVPATRKADRRAGSRSQRRLLPQGEETSWNVTAAPRTTSKSASIPSTATTRSTTTWTPTRWPTASRRS